jgi:ATP-dependent DNA ligase
VVGFAGDERRPALVLALRNAAGQLRTFGVTRAIPESQSEPILGLLNHSGPVQPAIPSRWQHDQVPSWRPVTAEAVCEVRFTNLDRARWLRFPATFLRWRPDRSPHDCGLEQLTLH